MSEEGTVTVQKSTIWKVSTIILGILLVISLFTGGFGLKGDKQDTPPTIPTGAVAGLPSTPVDVSVDDDPVKGEKNAPVTIIEFSDFQCPFCGRFFLEALPQIEEKYIKTGKARLVYRDFPLSSLHPMAQKAAEASECADEQGKFWEMHDKIFQNQGTLSLSNLKQWATDLKLDTKRFNTCLDSSKYASEVQKDFNDGQAAGVSGTPSFFINGQLLVGAQPFSSFQAAIESELS
jgi:protein-disulfide isomerase